MHPFRTWDYCYCQTYFFLSGVVLFRLQFIAELFSDKLKETHGQVWIALPVQASFFDAKHFGMHQFDEADQNVNLNTWGLPFFPSFPNFWAMGYQPKWSSSKCHLLSQWSAQYFLQSNMFKHLFMLTRLFVSLRSFKTQTLNLNYQSHILIKL